MTALSVPRFNSSSLPATGAVSDGERYSQVSDSSFTYGSVFRGCAVDAGEFRIRTMTDIKAQQQSITKLALDTTDETLLAMAAMVLRGEADHGVWPDHTERGVTTQIWAEHLDITRACTLIAEQNLPEGVARIGAALHLLQRHLLVRSL